jgi:hypothetical protein
MSKSRVIDVTCKCGYQLLTYYKAGRGRLIKCFLNRIHDDGVGLVRAPLGSRPTCPACGRTVGEIRIVRGQPALKLNQGTIHKTIL